MSGETRFIIAGAGGLGCEVALYVADALSAGTLNGVLAGFLDDVNSGMQPDLNLPILGAVDTYRPQKDDRVIVAVGAPGERALLAGRLTRLGARFATIVHPLAYVARLAELGEGTIVAPFATIGARARLGQHCLVNTHAGIGHDVVMGEFSAVSPHAVINGRVRLGAQVLVGSGAVVTPCRNVGDRAQISAGTVLQSDVPADTTMWGNPARPLPKASQG